MAFWIFHIDLYRINDVEDIFEVGENLLSKVFKKFTNKKFLYQKFPRIPYEEAMLKYGSDKPDLRNPL